MYTHTWSCGTSSWCHATAVVNPKPETLTRHPRSTPRLANSTVLGAGGLPRRGCTLQRQRLTSWVTNPRRPWTRRGTTTRAVLRSCGTSSWCHATSCDDGLYTNSFVHSAPHLARVRARVQSLQGEILTPGKVSSGWKWGPLQRCRHCERHRHMC